MFLKSNYSEAKTKPKNNTTTLQHLQINFWRCFYLTLIQLNMDYKEEAEKLYGKYLYQICNDNGISVNDSVEVCAKQCALIDIQNRIDLMRKVILDCHLEESEQAVKIYRGLKSIKSELENL